MNSTETFTQILNAMAALESVCEELIDCNDGRLITARHCIRLARESLPITQPDLVRQDEEAARAAQAEQDNRREASGEDNRSYCK